MTEVFDKLVILSAAEGSAVALKCDALEKSQRRRSPGRGSITLDTAFNPALRFPRRRRVGRTAGARRRIGRTAGALLVGQGFNAGQLLAFEKFEAGAPAGGDVRYLIGIAGLIDGRH